MASKSIHLHHMTDGSAVETVNRLAVAEPYEAERDADGWYIIRSDNSWVILPPSIARRIRARMQATEQPETDDHDNQ